MMTFFISWIFSLIFKSQLVLCYFLKISYQILKVTLLNFMRHEEVILMSCLSLDALLKQNHQRPLWSLATFSKFSIAITFDFLSARNSTDVEYHILCVFLQNRYILHGIPIIMLISLRISQLYMFTNNTCQHVDFTYKIIVIKISKLHFFQKYYLQNYKIKLLILDTVILTLQWNQIQNTIMVFFYQTHCHN